MKRCISLLLALLLALSGVSAFAQAAVTADAALPAVGDVVHGFEVVEVTDFPLINADVVYFVHQKTGAELLYLANDDTNRVFDLTFKTPAESDMGVPHVFEHATLGGSEKYPSKELFFNLSYQTYNTYMNAATYSHMTTYPVASLSEDQLYMYADFYTDSCLHPMIHTDESIFTEEAWRYAMDSADADLTLAGTVYSEMQGAYDITRASYQNWCKTMFPGSTAANSSGGVPSEIPNMTWEDVKAFHDAYYHPSNSLACLYGSFDHYERFLALLDGYYAAYDKADIVIADAGYTPITEQATSVFHYPVEASSDTENGGSVYYGFRVDTADQDEINAVDMLTTLLSASSSPVIMALEEALPAAVCGCAITLDTPSPAVVFYADGINAQDAEIFRLTVDGALTDILADGFDKEAVDAVIAAFRMNTLLVSESANLGVDLLPNIAFYWASTGDWHGYMNFIAALDRFAALNEDGTFLSLIEKHLVNNQNAALAVTLPEAGLKEKNDAALAAQLAEKKAQMSADEISAIVAQTQALALQSENTAAQYVSQLQVVTVDSLPEEKRIYDYTDVTGEDGVRRIDVQANVDGVGQAMVLLNVGDMPQEMLHWFHLYLQLLGDVDTSAHSRQQLASLTTRYLYDKVIKASLPYNDQTDLFVRIAWIAADEDMQAAYDLIDELLFDSQFTDAKRVAEAVSSLKTSLKNVITQTIYSQQLSRAQTIAKESSRVYSYMTSFDFYAFLEQVEALLAEQPEAVLATLAQVQQLVKNGAGAISVFAGSPESAANHRAIADNFIAGLDKRDITPAVYDIPAPARNEGIIIDSSVQYNLIFATWEELGLEGFNAEFDAVTALVSDVFLYPLLRDQYGAYSVLHGANEAGVYLLSYRDPNVVETFDVYQQLPALIADLQIDQETLDGYILSSYAYYAQSEGELLGASNMVLDVIAGDDPTRALNWMQQLKIIKAEDLHKFSTVYANLVANGVRSTSGGAGAIENNAALYENILNPFGAVDLTNVEFTDCTAEHPCYDAVRFVFENGLMEAADEQAFGADAPATLGDFAAACYVLLGGDINAEAAIGYLSQFGILPAQAPDTPLTREQLIGYTISFAAAAGAGITADMLPAFEDMQAPATRAETALVIVTFYQLL